MTTLLLVDDEKNTRDGLRRALAPHYNVLLAENGDAALNLLATHSIDLMLSDVRMPGMDGLTLLKRVQAQYPTVVCVMLTAYGNVETAVEAMKLGAADFLIKPVNLDHLELVLQRTLRASRVESENLNLRRQLDSKFGLENIIGRSPVMEEVFDVVRQAAPTQASILIQGPSGTGKELVAHAIHRLSTRAKGPFIAVHCAALTATLLESELFGHERGAFTGATARRKGRFELADGGTLFLDEISEIDPTVQVKLLRVLEERTFERVGGDETIEVDIRLIAATNRDLRQSVADGTFREDLYYRLDVISIHMPPLSARSDDIPALSGHFLKEFSAQNHKQIDSITPETMNILQRYAWPGNVRELRNTIEKMVVLSRGQRLTTRDIPPHIRTPNIVAADLRVRPPVEQVGRTPPHCSTDIPVCDPSAQPPPHSSDPSAPHCSTDIPVCDPPVEQVGPVSPKPPPPHSPGTTERLLGTPPVEPPSALPPVEPPQYSPPVEPLHPSPSPPFPPSMPPRHAVEPPTLADIEKHHILAVLHKHNGNRTSAARELGISRRTLHRKLSDWQTDPPPPAGIEN